MKRITWIPFFLLSIHVYTLNWITAFLSNRKQRVCVRGQFSKPADVLNGVPQGSVLGLLLLVLFVNDIPEVVSVIVKLYVDDTDDKRNMSRSLQQDLEKKMEEWSRKWLWYELKCKVMYFGRNNHKHTYVLGNTELAEVTNEKDLGIYITEDAKPSLLCC